MTEIEKKALALVNEAAHCDEPWVLDNVKGGVVFNALCRAIEQHEAYRQEVSDAVEEYTDRNIHAPITYLGRFIIAKPDPLVDALGELADRNLEARQAADTLRAAIEKRGGKIVWEDK